MLGPHVSPLKRGRTLFDTISSAVLTNNRYFVDRLLDRSRSDPQGKEHRAMKPRRLESSPEKNSKPARWRLQRANISRPKTNRKSGSSPFTRCLRFSPTRTPLEDSPLSPLSPFPKRGNSSRMQISGNAVDLSSNCYTKNRESERRSHPLRLFRFREDDRDPGGAKP